MKSKLWVNNLVSLETLGNVPIPPVTETYCPIPYLDYVSKIIDYGEEFLTDFDLVEQKHGLAREGQFMFGLNTYKPKGDVFSGMDLAVGYRTSYNKLLSNSMAIGSEVIVCSNLLLTGNIVVMRKHTKNVLDDLDNLFGDAMSNAGGHYGSAIRQEDILRRLKVQNNDAYSILGIAVGNNIIGTRQMKKALKEWNEPSYKEHGKGTAWTLYQAFTESLKSAPIQTYMEQHRLVQMLFESSFSELDKERDLLN